jgi:hypothetical protein
MTYDQADERAASLVEMWPRNGARIVFVCMDATSGDFMISTHNSIFLVPVKRYRKLTTGAVEVATVTTWKRN